MRWLVPVATIALLSSSSALASSHREAPFITKNPKVDGTDFYMFGSYQPSRGNFVTLIANYQPLQDAYGGPNYFSMDPEALYEIHVDNTGDAVEDLTFQFRFSNTLIAGGKGIALPIAQPDGGALQTVAIPLINAYPVGQDDGGFSRVGMFQGQLETYTMGIVRGPRRGAAAQLASKVTGGATVFEKPLDNIGSKTFPANSYANYAASFIYDINIPGCGVPARVFVGQRKEGFAVNLGTIFDLINAPLATITNAGARGALPNTIGAKNISTIAIEVDKSCLTNAAGGTVIGGWSTASVRQARVINPQGNYQVPTREGGAWAQVSRLGSPLVNEVVIGVPDKDKFNSSEPKDDLANFAPYVTNPTLPALIEILFPAAPAPRVFPRGDLIVAFLTGVTGVNKFNGTNATPAVAEMLRLNTGLPHTPKASQNNLGALQCFVNQTQTMAPVLNLPPGLGGTNTNCDVGFPNGRRPGDDVVDIALRVSMGALLSLDDAPAGNAPLHDAVLQDAAQFDAVFPYLTTPNPGT